MIVRCLFDKMVSISELKPNPRNRNKHPETQIDQLAKILNYQGWRYPIKVSKQSGFITAGHGRLEAAKINGWNEVPVNYQDYDTPDQEYLDLQADNAVALQAELDIDGIRMDLTELGPIDTDLLGIEGFKLVDAEKLEPGCDEDEVPDHVEPKTKLGDVYQLGSHRLLCGDSTSIDDVEKLISGEKADMVFTDPPYGMFLDTDYTKMNGYLEDGSYIERNKHKKVLGDHEDFKPELINTIFAAFPDAKEVFLWGADYYADILPNRNDGSWVVWDKTGTEDRDKGFGSSFELCWSKQRHKRTFARIWWQGIFGVKDDQKGRVHPTQKPVQLAEWFFERWGAETKSVVDLFGGSGSTLIACEKTNRKCFMMELDPHYCDVIVARWEKYTGKKAQLINGETA